MGVLVGDREGLHLEAGCRRGDTGLRLPHQDAHGLPGRAGSRPRLPCGGAAQLGRRFLQLLVALGALVVSAGWWMAVVELWPEATRPHVGGTTSDSWIDLIFSRSAGILDTAAQGANLSGRSRVAAHLQRPTRRPGRLAAASGRCSDFVAACRDPARAPHRRTRAGYLLWGLWTLVMMVVFSGVRHAALLLHGGACARHGGAGRRRVGGALAPGPTGPPLGVAPPRRHRGDVPCCRLSCWAVSRATHPGLAIAVLVAGLAAAAGLLYLLLRPMATRPLRSPCLHVRPVGGVPPWTPSWAWRRGPSGGACCLCGQHRGAQRRRRRGRRRSCQSRAELQHIERLRARCGRGTHRLPDREPGRTPNT